MPYGYGQNRHGSGMNDIMLAAAKAEFTGQSVKDLGLLYRRCLHLKNGNDSAEPVRYSSALLDDVRSLPWIDSITGVVAKLLGSCTKKPTGFTSLTLTRMYYHQRSRPSPTHILDLLISAMPKQSWMGATI